VLFDGYCKKCKTSIAMLMLEDAVIDAGGHVSTGSLVKCPAGGEHEFVFPEKREGC